MRTVKTIAFALIVAIGTTVCAQTKKVDVSGSKINWVGSAISHNHKGTIDLKDGNLVFKGAKLIGGNFNVDMNTIIVTDIDVDHGKTKLEGHLKAEDFFGTAKNPNATLVFKSIGVKSKNTYTVVADLTIKSITKPVTFDMVVSNNVATASVIVDRTKYDIKYNSGSFFQNLGDSAISDNFDLAVSLKF